MRNINIVSKDVQDFKILIEILAGFRSEVNAEIIKDKNAYVKARQAITHDDDDSLEYSSEYSEENIGDDNDDSEVDESEESEEVISKKSAKVKGKVLDNGNKSSKVTKSNKPVSNASKSIKPVSNASKSNKPVSNASKSIKPVSKVTKTNIDDAKKKAEKNIKEAKVSNNAKVTKSTKTKPAVKKSQKSKNESDEDSENVSEVDSDEESNDEDSQIDDIVGPAEDNPGQIKILTPNDDQVMLVFLTLDAKHFEKFEVIGKNDDPSASYTIGLDIEELNKFMKGVPKEGTLSIYQDTSMMEFICFDVSDENRGTANICDLRRINIEKPPDKNIEVNVSMVVRMPCALFHKACKDLQQFDPFVEFICDRDTFKIVCMGEQSNQERRFTDNSRKKYEDNGTDQNYDIKITLSKDIEKENRKAHKGGSDTDNVDEKLEDNNEKSDSEDSEDSEDSDSENSDSENSDSENSDSENSDDEPEVIRLLFDLRYINYMYKCQNLADYVYIHLTPRGIMFLSYEINMLGNLLVGIAPKNRDTDQDYNEDNDKYYEDDKAIKIKRDLS